MKFKYLLNWFLAFSFIASSFSSYGKSDSDFLIHYEYMGEFTKETAEATLNKTPALASLSVHYNVKLYKINYATSAPDGSSTVASGLVAMPVTDHKVSVLSYLHGTRFERNDVPSRNNEKNHIYIAAFSNSEGYMTVMPDYLGLGDNELPLHPYVQAETLASSSINMLVAAKELAKILSYPIDNKLFINGYSEGGFSTLVMFDMLVKEYPELPITAVSPGSAPYDWNETMSFILLQPGPRATAYVAYFFYSLQVFHHYWANFDEVFQAPYNVLIPELFDGNHTNAEVLQALPQNPVMILQASFLNAIINETDKNIEALKKDFNHYDFIPSAPMLLVGTKGDHDVPYHGSEIGYEHFSQRSDKVWIKSVSDNLDHVQAMPYILKEQIDFFRKYR